MRKESGKPGGFDNMTVEELRAFIQADIDAAWPNHGGNDTEH
jgi:hypothetical protein